MNFFQGLIRFAVIGASLGLGAMLGRLLPEQFAAGVATGALLAAIAWVLAFIARNGLLELLDALACGMHAYVIRSRQIRAIHARQREQRWNASEDAHV